MYNKQLLKDDMNTIRYAVLKILKIMVKNKTTITFLYLFLYKN